MKAILLDMAMPGMSGVEALSLIRRIRPDVHVIVSSGFHDGGDAAQFNHFESCSFLPKPYTREQLLAAVLPVLGPGEAL